MMAVHDLLNHMGWDHLYDFCNWFRGAQLAREAQEAFAAIWMVSFRTANNCWETRSYSAWSAPSKPRSFQEPIPPNTQADCAASSKASAWVGMTPSTTRSSW